MDNNFSRVVGLIMVVVVIVLGLAFGLPWYTVWQQEMAGKAEFAKAEQNSKIKI